MYRLWNYLFGYDYIHWSNFADSGIARVRIDGEGKVWYWRYRLTKCAYPINESSEVRWLTCHSSKYLNKQNKDKL